MNILTLIGGCWVNQTRGKLPPGMDDPSDAPPDTGTCEDEGADDDDDGECDPDDDSGSCWDPPDVGW